MVLIVVSGVFFKPISFILLPHIGHLISLGTGMIYLGTTIFYRVFGNRGYRACQFEAGVVAGQVYLSSYAQGRGASGSEFLDAAVTELFSPHARDTATMIAVGTGVPTYNARPGKVLRTRLTKSELAAKVQTG